MGSHAQDTTPAEPAYTRPILIGTAVGIVLFTIGVTAMGVATGYDLRDSFGLGIFCSFWGGIGFGAWFGAAYAISRPEPVPAPPVALQARHDDVSHAA
jgi:hypothetical protein